MSRLGAVISDQQILLLNTMATHNRVAVVKSRQIGVTTASRAYCLHQALTKPGIRVFLISNKQRGAHEVGRMDLQMLEGLEEDLEVSLIASRSKSEIVLENGSRLLYFSGAATGDRGYTADILHVTEFAHVAQRADFLSTLLQSIPKGGKVILESSPSHWGDPLHRLADRKSNESHVWEVLFFPWHEFKEYAIEVDAQTRTEEERKTPLDALSDAQIAWRRHKIDELGGDILSFKREFPMSLDEAYSLSAGTWLDGDTQAKIKCDAAQWSVNWEGPVGAGYHVATFAGAVPHWQRSYVIGYDPAGGVGQDNSVACVVERETLRIVQVLSSNRKPISDFSERVAILAEHWNKAHIRVELNNHGTRAYNVLLDTKAANRVDKFTTTHRTKTEILDNLRMKIHSELLTQVDPDTAKELRTMALQPHGQCPAALIGEHDDRVMALALALSLHSDKPGGSVPMKPPNHQLWTATPRTPQRAVNNNPMRR